MGRFILSETNDWKLEHPEQDIRGWKVRDDAGKDVGTVRQLIANTDSERVETIVLDSGKEYPARDIAIGDDVVHLHRSVGDGAKAEPVVKTYHNTRIRRHGAAETTGATTGTAGYEAHRDAFRRNFDTNYASTGAGWATFEPAYRHGYTYGADSSYGDRSYADLEPEMRSRYERKHGEGTFERVKDAVKHAFNHSRRS